VAFLKKRTISQGLHEKRRTDDLPAWLNHQASRTHSLRKDQVKTVINILASVRTAVLEIKLQNAEKLDGLGEDKSFVGRVLPPLSKQRL
jgi:hypothetical protein